MNVPLLVHTYENRLNLTTSGLAFPRKAWNLEVTDRVIPCSAQICLFHAI